MKSQCAVYSYLVMHSNYECNIAFYTTIFVIVQERYVETLNVQITLNKRSEFNFMKYLWQLNSTTNLCKLQLRVYQTKGLELES